MKIYPLSHVQMRIWYLQKKYSGSPLFNIGGTVRINGNIDIPAFKEAIVRVMQQNAILRMRFTEKDGQVRQYISDGKIEVNVKDFSLESHSYERFSKWSLELAEKPFEMLDCPLHYFALYKTEQSVMGYFVKFHHIIADGWSFKLLTEQIKRMYENIVRDVPIDTFTSFSYLDYIRQEQSYRGSSDMNQDKLYWNDMFLNYEPVRVQLGGRLTGERRVCRFGRSFQDKMDQFLKNMDITLNVFLTAVYILYEYKKYGKDDIVIGMPLLGRSGRKQYKTIGCFTNTMPYRCKIRREEPILDFLWRVCAEVRDIYRHQRYPYHMLYGDLNQDENGAGKLYHVCINDYHTMLPRNIDGKQCRNTEFYCGEQDYALQIIIRQWDDGSYELDYDYQTTLYSGQLIEQLHQQLLVLMNQVMDQSNLKVKETCLLNGKERFRYLYEYNQTDRKLPEINTWIALFENLVETQPDIKAVSIYGKNESMTYQELDLVSNLVSGNLQAAGVRNGTRIAVIPEHDMKSLAVIIGIMKCGGVYVPVDQESPDGRIKQIIGHSKASYYIAAEERHDLYCRYLDINNLLLPVTEYSPLPTIERADIAYIIYTSGSTGTPKGVMITHGNLLNYLWWAMSSYIRSRHEVFALYSSFAFDFTITSILLPLISGGEIRVFQHIRKQNVITEILKDEAVTIVKITPSMIRLMDEAKPNRSRIHTFIVGGENLYREACEYLYRKFHGDILIYNEYGPTEATIGCMIYLYQQDQTGSIPIGRPIANTSVYLLDQDMQPVPDDTTGEIYIGGAGVASCYDQNSLETNQRFLKNPFQPAQRLYKTGDLAYRKPGGDLVYVGRDDEEIKIRGYRVNLYEIETSIRKLNGVKDAVVNTLVREDGTCQLCAYYIGETSYKKGQLKDQLGEYLPGYMVPDFFIPLNSYPLTINGKVDKTKLPLPIIEKSRQPVKKAGYKQAVLMDVVRNIFCDPNIGIEDHFYGIGGDSIKAIQISSRLREQGFELSVQSILENAYFWKMEKYMKVSCKKGAKPYLIEGDVKHLPIIDWFLEQKIKDEGAYNQSILLELKEELSFDILNQVFLLLLRHHDTLRLNMRQDKSLFYNQKHLELSVVLHTLDLSKEELSFNNVANKRLEHRFDLEHDLLIRPCLIHKNDKRYLYITAHHLVIDGVSFRILLEDLFVLVKQQMTGNAGIPYAKTESYQTYAEEYEKWAKQIAYDETYLQQIRESEGNRWLKPDRTKGCVRIGIKCEKLKQDITKDFLGRANKPFHTKPVELLFITFVRAVHMLTGAKDILIDVEEHGRNILKHLDVNHTVGWFTNQYPIRVLIKDEEIGRQIRQIKDTMRDIGKIGFQFGAAKYVAKRNIRAYNRLCLNYHGVADTPEDDYFKLKNILYQCESTGEEENASFFEINVFVIENKLHLYFKFDQSQELLQRLMKQYVKEMISLIAYCSGLQQEVYTPSDFDLVKLNEDEMEQITEQLLKE